MLSVPYVYYEPSMTLNTLLERAIPFTQAEESKYERELMYNTSNDYTLLRLIVGLTQVSLAHNKDDNFLVWLFEGRQISLGSLLPLEVVNQLGEEPDRYSLHNLKDSGVEMFLQELYKEGGHTNHAARMVAYKLNKRMKELKERRICATFQG